MTPQTLNEGQQKLVEECKVAHRRYRRLKAASDAASVRLTDMLREQRRPVSPDTGWARSWV